MKKILSFFVVIFVIFSLYSLLLNSNELRRLWHINNLFDEKSIIENFRNINKLFPGKTLSASTQLNSFQKADVDQVLLPENFVFNQYPVSSDYFLDRTNTTSLLVLHKGRIVFEQYYLNETKDDLHISWSVAKSFISALVGIAHEEGLIKDLEEPVKNYVPALIGSGYENVRIINLLQMSSGISFSEDYGDRLSDINIFGVTLALGWSFDDFVKNLKNEKPQGTYNRYVSIDTQVLGMLIREACQCELADYMQEKIWQPLGMESNAFWISDHHNMELALGGLNMNARDYARFGQLYLNDGKSEGQQIVPLNWINSSTRPNGPHLLPGENPNSDSTWGYGYQWWIPEGEQGEFLAAGIYDQYIYINPNRETVIVKLSANPYYVEDNYISEKQSLAFFRAISAQFDANDSL